MNRFMRRPSNVATAALGEANAFTQPGQEADRKPALTPLSQMARLLEGTHQTLRREHYPYPALAQRLGQVSGSVRMAESSRRLKREAQRNVELMWLTGRLIPDFKTIANFRKDNGPAIRRVCRQFVVLCQQLSLFAEALVAIDGSKFKAVNNRDRNFTSAKLQRRMEEIESSISRYLTALDTADRQEPAVAQAKAERLHSKIAALKTKMQKLRDIEGQLEAAPDKQISLTDPDARRMMTRGTGLVGYNIQAAVDTKHHLIVTHEVTNDGVDRDQLSAMAKQARDAMGVESLSVVADRGYFKSEEILACHEAGITKANTSPLAAAGRFGREDFIYDAAHNEYRCPAGERLIWRFATVEKGLKLHRYWSSHCQDCAAHRAHSGGCPNQLNASDGHAKRPRGHWTRLNHSISGYSSSSAFLHSLGQKRTFSPEFFPAHEQQEYKRPEQAQVIASANQQPS